MRIFCKWTRVTIFDRSFYTCECEKHNIKISQLEYEIMDGKCKFCAKKLYVSEKIKMEREYNEEEECNKGV